MSTRISSRNTFFVKRVFPVLWFGIIAVGLIAALAAARAGKTVPPPIFIAPLLMLVIGYALMRTLVFDLADEVLDEGDALRVRFPRQSFLSPLFKRNPLISELIERVEAARQR